MKANNIILIGMPGCGKSYIGAKLALVLDKYICFDTDSIIEKTQGMKISEIFEKYSEDYFRKLEYDTIKLLCSGTNKIISIGGGAFENPDTRNRLLNFGKVYYLKSNLDILYNRVSVDNSRPLLNNGNPRDTLENLLIKRELNFKKAHHEVDTDSMTEDEIIEFIIGSMDETSSAGKCK